MKMKNLNEKEVHQVVGGFCDIPPRDWDQIYNTVEDWRIVCLEQTRIRLEARWANTMGDSDSGNSCGGDAESGCGEGI